MRKSAQLGIAVGLLTGLLAGPGHADELSELKAQLKAMSKRIETLQAQQKALEGKQARAAAAQAQTAAQAQAASQAAAQATAQAQAAAQPAPAAPAATPVAAGKLPNSFLIPGTNTSLRIGGMARMHLAVDFDSTMGNSQIVIGPYTDGFGGIPYNGTPQKSRSGQLQFEARESRLNFETLTPTAYGDLRTLIEGDFYGAGGSKLSTNSVSLRLRHAMAELGPFLLGQYWSNFADLGQGPDVFDFGGPAGLLATNRLPQARYTHAINNKSQASISVEQPVQDWNGANGVTFVAGGNNISTNSIDKTPDVVARYTYFDTWGRQSFSAAGRLLNYDTGLPRQSDDQFGFALGYQGRFNTVGKDNLYYSAIYVNGASRYMTQISNVSAILDGNNLKNVTGYGGNIGYQRWWSDQWRSTFNAGFTKYDIPHPGGQYRNFASETQSLYANLMWSPIPRALLGLEYTYARIANDNGQKGDGQRLLFATQFAF
ncbi:DcaP family trimeric outer membrane transporter [Azospirillum soli]|uniref:DcaP family trimeric outer membrane transporter n=1 Tax=Azospirillum soli TaxID=1304799 RepID=UPI001AE363A0|nr:DcaP family trimeric outer membrane transporter [Azospirillum soli]MBP2316854.1 hypothetical protein [Azospirillum soli]